MFQDIQQSDDLAQKDAAAQCVTSDTSNIKVKRWLAESTLFQGLVLDIPVQDATDVRSLENCLRERIPGAVEIWRLSSRHGSTMRLPSRSEPAVVSQPPAREQYSAQQYTSEGLPDGQHVSPRMLHELTGVHKLHDRGITGQGVTVAVLDLGYDYLHPAFRHSVKTNSSLRYGIDLVGDDFAPPFSRPLPSADAFAECLGHGTHVSALIAGRHEEIGFRGVAPDVNFEHYRISGCGFHLMDDETVVEALLLAHARNVDVISISFTNMKGPFSNELVSEILRRIQEEDRIICVVAAGNDGRAGPFSAASPSGDPGQIATGAVNSIHVVKSNPRARATYTLGGEEHLFDFEWAPATPSRFPESLPLCVLSMDTSITSDACGRLPSYTRRASRFRSCIVLIRRGGCSITEKLEYVAAQGASYALVYDHNVTEGWDLFLYKNKVHGISGAGSLSAASGEALASLVENGTDLTMKMDSNFTLLPYVRVRENPFYPPGEIYVGSSWGPSGDLSGFPSLLGPGGSIWSAEPRSSGGYGTHSGTSISAPYLAGCAALLRSAKPLESASDIKRRLIHTAKPLLLSNGSGTLTDRLAPTWQQGGGLVNPLRALNSQTKLSADFLSFNDTEFIRNLTFTIVNESPMEMMYNISSIAAATVATLNSESRRILPFSEENDIASPSFLAGVDHKAASIAFNISSLALAPGSSASIHVSADVSHVANELTCPLYSGFIIITSTSGESLSLPYGGVGCRTRNIPTLPSNWNATFLAAATYNESVNVKLSPIEPHTLFKIPRPIINAVPDFKLATKYPTIKIKLAMISPGVEVFAKQCGSTSDGYSRVAGDPGSAKPGGYSRVMPSSILWQGRLENGSVAVSGCYTLKFCALRLWGMDRDCIISPEFSIIYE